MNKAKIVIIFSLLLIACKNKTADNEHVYATENLYFDVDKNKMLENIDSIEIKEIIEIKDVLIARVDKLLMTDDRLFVLDRTFSKYLFVLDRQGNLLYKIGDKGVGPGEYIIGPKNFYVDEELGQFTVFESETKKIFTYNLYGDLIKIKILQESWPYSYAKSDSLFYFAYKTIDKDTHLLRVQNSEENTLLKYKKIKEKRDFVARNCFYVTPYYVYFIEDYNNNVIVLKNDSIQKILSFDFGVNSIQKDFLTKYKGEEFIQKVLSNTKATNVRNIVETDKLFTFQVVYGKMGLNVIQNKINGDYLIGPSFTNEIFPCDVSASYNNNLVSVLSSEYIEHLLTFKYENPKDWENILKLAHPAIKEILINSEEGNAHEYIFIYDIHM